MKKSRQFYKIFRENEMIKRICKNGDSLTNLGGNNNNNMIDRNKTPSCL